MNLEIETIDLKPRELDALIAERVMGWRVHDKREPLVGVVFPTLEAMETEIPHFSTDMSDAWAVVLRLKESWLWSIENDQGELNEWTVEVLSITHELGSKRIRFLAEAPTAPHAICLAALQTTQP
jgi:hypothetical protein